MFGILVIPNCWFCIFRYSKQVITNFLIKVLLESTRYFLVFSNYISVLSLCRWYFLVFHFGNLVIPKSKTRIPENHSELPESTTLIPESTFGNLVNTKKHCKNTKKYCKNTKKHGNLVVQRKGPWALVSSSTNKVSDPNFDSL